MGLYIVANVGSSAISQTYSIYASLLVKVWWLWVMMRGLWVELWVVPMMSVVFLGCSSNIACSVHHSVLAKAPAVGLGKGWFSIASLRLCGDGCTNV